VDPESEGGMLTYSLRDAKIARIKFDEATNSSERPLDGLGWINGSRMITVVSGESWKYRRKTFWKANLGAEYSGQTSNT
jgi:hypothetical protein